MNILDIFHEEELKNCLIKRSEMMIEEEITNNLLKGLEPKEGKIVFCCFKNEVDFDDVFDVDELYIYTKDEEIYFILLSHGNTQEDFVEELNEDIESIFTIFDDDGMDENVYFYEETPVREKIKGVFADVDCYRMTNLYKGLYGDEKCFRRFQEDIAAYFEVPLEDIKYVD